MKFQIKRKSQLTRRFMAHLLVVSLVVLAMPTRLALPTTEARSMAPADLRLKSESQLRNEANLYQTAINEISKISSMRLATVKDLETANAIVAKHISNLKYARSRSIVMALSDASFISAIRRKSSDKVAAGQFVVELGKDRTSIFKVSGGQALSDSIRRTLEDDIAKILRAAAQLNKASEDVKAKLNGHHAPRTVPSTGYSPEVEPAAGAPAELKAEHIAVIIIVAAVVASPALTLAVLSIGSAPVNAFIVGYAVLVTIGMHNDVNKMILDLLQSGGSEERQDRVEECKWDADRKYGRCMDGAKEAGMFRGVAEAACYAEWLVSRAACLAS